jgi:hypothetical protein
MKRIAWSVCAVALLAGCATGSPRAVATPGASTFTGEVWTWDEQLNTITLNEYGNIFRVKVSPDQFVGLRLHQRATIRGELDGPADLTVATLSPGVLEPTGRAEDMDVRGVVSAIDPAGKISVTTDRGPLQVWTATPGMPFKDGDPVHVKVRLQPLAVRPATSEAAQASASPELHPAAASPPSTPGDYAVVRGQVLAADAGRLTVSSPRGPIQVMAPAGTSYRVSDYVEVRTSVHPAP